MRSTIDSRWLIAVAIVLLFFFFDWRSLYLPPVLVVAVLGGCAWWMLQAGMGPWRGRAAWSGKKETYWRGQRIAVKQPVRARWQTPAPLPLGSSLFYFALSAVLALAAARLVLRLLGVF